MLFTSPTKIFFGIFSLIPAVTTSEPFCKAEACGTWSKIKPEPKEPLTIAAWSVWLTLASVEKLELVTKSALLELRPA